MWVVNPLVTLPSPHLEALARPSYPEVLQIKERTPTISSFVGFTFKLTFVSFKEFGGAFALVEEATWFSPIVVVLKKNGKFWIYMDFRKLNVAMKKDPYFLPLMEEILYMVAEHGVYLFMDDLSLYH